MLLLAGCAVGPRYDVTVSAISDGQNSGETYALLPSDPDISPTSLQFREFAGYVERALAIKGYTPAENPEQADLAIFISYGIGDPRQHRYSYSMPVMGQTGVSSSSTYGTINTFGNTATYSGTTTYTPTYGVVGYQQYSGTKTTYFRHLSLTAFDLRHYNMTGEPLQIWRTTVGSRGIVNDLRRVFPILVAASLPYIGVDTGQNIRMVISERSPEVLKIKGLDTDPE